MYKSSRYGTENKTEKEFYEDSLNASYQENSLEYNTKLEEEDGDIVTIIPDLDKKYHDKSRENGEISVTNGKIVYKGKDEKIIEIAKNLGYEIDPYKTHEETDSEGNKLTVLESSEKNLKLMSTDGTVTLPYDIDVIDEGTFANLKGLKKIIIPYTVKEIRKNAFSYNTDIEEVIFQTKDGQGCEVVGDSAFFECSNLSKVQLPETLSCLRLRGVY